jgi:hypothetical protein
MFARTKKDASAVTDNTETAPSPIVVALGKMRKSEWLTTAEAGLRSARADRAAASERLRELIAEKAESSGDHTAGGFDRQIMVADAAVRALDPKIAECRAELAAARAAWHPSADRALADPVEKAVAEANGLLARLAEIADDLRAAGRFAADAGFLDAAPHPVRHAPSLLAAISDARSCLQRNA